MITVALADDHRLMREGLRILLEADAGIRVVGEASDGREALRLVRDLAPDVLVLDITMPRLNGVDACRQIAEDGPTRVVALSMHEGHDFVAAMFRAGATGYVLKDAAPEELVAAVRAAAAGRRYVCSALTDLVLADYAVRLAAKDATPASILSPRHCEVLQLLAEGQSSREIAVALHLSTRTIETYRAQIMAKLDCGNLAELTKYAIRHGLTDLGG